ncbi:vanadium-dependent haloperoxidase [Flagellimonas sp. HMM57]|uniref:vanadium-dependent haloperoxidase n=1 Tax=unclassified Flagellimonas TaxID=2644544 RepID=UPI0013D4838F|nr:MULTISPECIES: vanadium-dependent haloperoxidase [unclassified Flagellimonas]UII77978.1 vanadium-dependent haloperoxidase [Flagellimonas sp. HMM57]
MKERIGLVFIFLIFLFSCTKKNESITIDPEDFHSAVDKVIEVMIHDIFSPPVASRIFAYPNIAAYEILALQENEYVSLANQVTDFTAIPTPNEGETVNHELAALIAHMELSKRLIFSEDRIEAYRDSLYMIWEDKNTDEFNASKNYGLKVAEHVAEWMSKDNYNQTRTMPKFTVDTENPSRWQPTPPAYMAGIEPHWNKIRPFVIDSASQFRPTPPPPFSMEEDSDFYKELKEVYDISNEITASGDTSEEVEIAQFWDCNPYVSVTRGHLMFATKKITPGAHWIGITKIASRNSNANLNKTVYAYTKASIAMADAFISCWDEKYRSNLIRPETLINEHIDENWEPILQTPPFPEYTSGHSVVSGAAAVALTHIFGDNFAFDDDTEVPYGLPVRSFTSFKQAANEAAISRMYGGIHYRAAVDIGVDQGRRLGKFVVDNLNMVQ